MNETGPYSPLMQPTDPSFIITPEDKKTLI